MISVILQTKHQLKPNHMKRLFSTRYSENGMSFALLILRIAAGGLIMTHGYSKLISFASRSSTFSDPYHIGHSTSMALVIFAEFFCGALIVMGLLTRLAAVPLIITMATVVFSVNHGKLTGNGELPVLFLACFITLLFAGPGKVSIDRLIGK
jgi:putative oxidoreductase